MADTGSNAAPYGELHSEVGHAEDHGSSGMPQLNADDWAPQLVWLALTFIFLYVMMARVALPRIATVLEERRDKIADDLDQAAQLKKETDQAIADYEAALAEARSKATAIAAENRTKLNQEIEQMRSDMEAELATKTAEAEKQINTAKAAALGNVRGVAIDVTEQIVQQLIGDDVGEAALAQSVDAELNR